MNKKIWLSSPHMGTEEFLNVKNAFETNWIAPLGPHVDGFEKDLATYINVEHVAALSSGTSAIHLALRLLGVGYEDEVICQSFTFSASANPINYQGATPVFIDSEKETWNMSPEFLREAIIDRIANGKKPKAIIVVHLYGMPAKMAEIVKIADEFQIPIIEDAAEALGSFYQNKACGSFGKFGILSFNGNKIITTSGGGALCSNDKLLIDKSRFLATQARDQAPHYQHSEIGFNYRMSNVLAAIGRGQMKVLKDRILKRRENYQFYFNQLSSIEGIKFLEEPKESLSNRWLTTILVDPKKTNGCDREKIRTQLEKVNIETRPLWKPMHLQPIFKDFPYYGSDVSEQLFDIGLCLPSGSNLVFEDLDFVVNSIKNLF
ncbi:MAG TPA: DegT/DnrJ/EryC1/StrS family aminotransferase [Sediminibacterium sp.]|uniref:DegT/DnrJ/EryC1/StrS family aminotransferase n=1 Tax=Sediminibacterium sp. TaxID=1917865 RepID=UPI0008BDB64C|nr:DegT/DnrJ/EryC1/StrS family aminotransferase [Sediminibacterium sp.]OHC84546.1 MAG: pyridoxal phosphate-dependent aminotransferase [Sphingobacteriia bacterium RIFOXYC2_FULL_35_18]OHC89058.1 MAG: pyridoxal phosphate-dependent aminotransferase [Sphingobacteriia bacterium RIFOXYD2_FULL_35_12]HLD53072.1 DegT/DnrJ/EryC1/StrS family aminotransferase [Sediminibacterium sp.]